MVKCNMDMSVPQDSQCAKCCIYCIEKCDYRCELSKHCSTEEEVYAHDCVNAYEE